MPQTDQATHANVARAITSLLGLDDSRPWLPRALIEWAHEGATTGAFDLHEQIGPEATGVIADALCALDSPTFRRAGWVVAFDGVLLATEEAWLDPDGGTGARLLASSAVVMALLLDRSSGAVTLCVDATNWVGVGRMVAAEMLYSQAGTVPPAIPA